MNLDPQQKQAVESESASILAVSGPGSGKSTVIVERIKRMVLDGVDPQTICAISFTNAASDVLQERLGDIKLGVNSTLHGFCLKLIKRYAPASGFTERVTVLDEKQTEEFVAKTIKALGKKASRCSVTEIEEAIVAGPFQLFATSLSSAQLVAAKFFHDLLEHDAVTFDTILHYGLKTIQELETTAWDRERVWIWDHLLVDEIQDSSAIDFQIYEAMPCRTKFFVGDPDQCQPPGTVVQTDNGPVKIENLTVGTLVDSWDRKAARITAGHRVTEIKKRRFSGQIITVGAGGWETRCTQNHKWLVRWTDRTSYVCITYLMFRRGFGWRVGWCQLFQHHASRSSHGLHFFARCRLEKADVGFILGVHQSRGEASVEESIISTRYGIPTVTFEPVNGAKHLTANNISRIFMESKPLAESCLTSFGRDGQWPFYVRDSKRSRTTYLVVQACNLLNGLHSIPLATGVWGPITVGSERYKGSVLSLRVEKTGSYIADSLCTLNSIYGFRGGSVNGILALKTDETIKLEMNYRSCVGICAAANALISHNRKRINKRIKWHDNSPVGTYEIRPQFETDQIEYAWIASQLPVDMDAAVLVRTRFIANEISKLLEAKGVPVQKREQSTLPKDFGTAKRVLTLLANPENDFLAHWFLTQTRSAKFADESKLKALEQFKSINQATLGIPADLDPAQVPQILAKFLIGPESVAIIKQAVDALPDGGGVAELLLELGSHDLESKLVGAGVFVGTIHAAKGREWDWVFIAGCDEGLLPQHKADTDIEEERRLMFVGMTRARSRLVLTTAATRRAHEWQRKPEPTEPSRFLKEIGLY
jgi:superfamily I DNA/RNA helicase